MIASPPSIAQRAENLRNEFDRSFIDPPIVDDAALVSLLAIRLGTLGYAIRLSEIAGLFVDKSITPVPGSNPALLGLAGFRGAIMPVYSLPTLIGHVGSTSPRWLVIAAAARVALAFEAFEEHLRVTQDQIMPQQSVGGAATFTRGCVHTAAQSRPIFHVSSVLDAIKT